MDNVKDDLYYARRILNDLSFIIKHTADLSQVEFETDEVLLDSIMFRFIQISANIKQLTDDFKIKQHQIPWKSIIGLRNKTVHEYGKVDLKIVYNTVKNDIPKLEKLFQDTIIDEKK